MKKYKVSIISISLMIMFAVLAFFDSYRGTVNVHNEQELVSYIVTHLNKYSDYTVLRPLNFAVMKKYKVSIISISLMIMFAVLAFFDSYRGTVNVHNEQELVSYIVTHLNKYSDYTVLRPLNFNDIIKQALL